jgi:hypothetical protein
MAACAGRSIVEEIKGHAEIESASRRKAAPG